MQRWPSFNAPQVLAFCGFFLSASSAWLAIVSLWYWKAMADVLPRGHNSGGAAFAINIPGMALELCCFLSALLAFFTLGVLLLCKPGLIRSWFTVFGFIGLVPAVLLFLMRIHVLVH